MPINNFIIATEPLASNLLKNFLSGNHAVADSKFVPNYFRPSPDRRLIFGGGENYTFKFPKNFEALVRGNMIKIYPDLSQTKIDYSWGGTLAITRSRLPYFKRIQKNVFSVSGFSGHGVALSVFSGKIIAGALGDNPSWFNIMSKATNRKFPGGSTLRWPLLLLGMFWYSLRDRLP